MKLDFEQRQRSGKLADEMAAADELSNYADVIIYLRDEIARLQPPSLESAAREIAREPLEITLAEEFKDAEYASGYAESHVDCVIAASIKVLREQRGWTQKQLAEKIGTKQESISRMEDVNYSVWSLSTLKKLADAFGVRVKVTFEDFSQLPKEAISMSRENLQRERHLHSAAQPGCCKHPFRSTACGSCGAPEQYPPHKTADSVRSDRQEDL